MQPPTKFSNKQYRALKLLVVASLLLLILLYSKINFSQTWVSQVNTVNEKQDKYVSILQSILPRKTTDEIVY